MKKSLIALSALMLLGCTTYRPPKWTKADTVRQGAYTAFHVVDWQQTREVADRNDFYEMNPILGPNPSRDQVDLYFLGTWVVMTGAAYLLPRPWRERLQYVGIVVESGVVTRNFAMGLRGRW